ncbi:hypothetical protein K466DRAFT_266224 [Polyporus arcularius HHB13444]|uniref:Uncharacterized protein n=1 Tax=Polyporus arcularius HHB13444 TaxID=1314778 RepID=A0A5C3PQK0_9APHY|nr:hypothetical protein K466DRAFT_266224 [Polyporus arcularius HHB13444]
MPPKVRHILMSSSRISEAFSWPMHVQNVRAFGGPCAALSWLCHAPFRPPPGARVGIICSSQVSHTSLTPSALLRCRLGPVRPGPPQRRVPPPDPPVSVPA